MRYHVSRPAPHRLEAGKEGCSPQRGVTARRLRFPAILRACGATSGTETSQDISLIRVFPVPSAARQNFRISAVAFTLEKRLLDMVFLDENLDRIAHRRRY